MTIRRQRKSFAGAIFPCFALLVFAHPAWAEGGSGVALPKYNDKYSAFVRQLEGGETNINYTEFRESLLESQQFKSAGTRSPDLSALRQQMRELTRQAKYAEIINVTKRMLSIDYTDMEAHKILQQTYKILGDMPNSQKYHDIEFGLLNSIMRKGDGRTCESAWPVIQINEEYFILQMLGAKLQKQSMENSGGACDRMEVQTDQGTKVYYFEISKIFKGYKKQGIH